MLGSPIGSDDFCDQFVMSRAVLKNQGMIEKLVDLNDPQVAFLLLRSCLSYCKMVYFMRTVPFGSLVKSSVKFDSMIIDCLSNLINFKLNTGACIQLSLGLNYGGLGIRRVSDHHAAAFFASIRSCLPSIRLCTGLSADRSIEWMNNSQTSLVPNIIQDLTPLKSQSAISEAIDKVSFNKLLDSLLPVDKARILSASAPHAGDFLVCPPIALLGLKLSPQEWSLAVAYRLGVEVLPSPSFCTAKGCNSEMDRKGLHAIRCGCEGDRIRRHNLLRNFFFHECKKAMMDPLKEPKNLIRNSEMRPADFGIPDYRPGIFMAYDVAVTDPSQTYYVSKSSSVSGHAAEAYSILKLSKYSDALDRDVTLDLTPLIVESFGRWSSSSLIFFRSLSLWLAARNPSSSATIIKSRLFQKASIILQRSNAKMILSRISFI